MKPRELMMSKEISFEDKHKYCIAWEQSGKSQLAFCMANGIAASTFHGWYKQYQKTLPSEGDFSPMVGKSSDFIINELSSIQCEIRLPNDTQLFLSLQERTLISIIQGMCHAATAPR
jgi:hypothetical protein